MTLIGCRCALISPVKNPTLPVTFIVIIQRVKVDKDFKVRWLVSVQRLEALNSYENKSIGSNPFFTCFTTLHMSMGCAT